MSTKLIPIEQAIEMKSEYTNRISPLIENYRGSGYKATEFAWIDIDSLKEYVALLEEVRSKNNKTISGVRIYFSAYPNENYFKSTDDDVDFPARETMFMVPTVRVEPTLLSGKYENLEHLPFCIKPDDSSDLLKGKYEIIEGLLHEKDNRTTDQTSNYTNKKSLVMNKASITPPPY